MKGCRRILPYREHISWDAKEVDEKLHFIMTIYFEDEKHLAIDMEFEQGRRYYFRNITWTGNSVYVHDVVHHHALLFGHFLLFLHHEFLIGSLLLLELLLLGLCHAVGEETFLNLVVEVGKVPGECCPPYPSGEAWRCHRRLLCSRGLP